MRRARIVLWQVLVVGLVVLGVLATGRGSAIGVVAGGAVLTASMLLQDFALGAAFRLRRRPMLALALFVTKLLLLLGVVLIGLRDQRLDPLSFAVGATTLLLAIVVEAWYSHPRAT